VHIHKNYRIRIGGDKQIYCSAKIYQSVREHVVKMDTNVYVPRRNHTDELLTQLNELVRNDPEQFSTNSRAVIAR
jgi:hypothetical protein